MSEKRCLGGRKVLKEFSLRVAPTSPDQLPEVKQKEEVVLKL